jgi:hypothetical protein
VADFGTQPKPLHHARTKPFDQSVRFRHELQHGRDSLRLLEVERNRALVTIVEVESRRQVRLDPRLGDAIDAQHVGAEIAEQGSGERHGADSTHLDDAKAIQRSRHYEISWLRKQSISAVEPDGVVDCRAADARGVGSDVAVLVAE